MWRIHFRKHRDDVLQHWHKKGLPVIWTGDVNRGDMPLLMPKNEKRAFKHGIDQIGWVTGGNGVELKLDSTKTIPMHVDDGNTHHAHVAIMKVRRA